LEGRRLIPEDQLKVLITEVIQYPIVIYSSSIKNRGNHSLIELNLDNLENSFGSVSIGDCEKISRNLQSILEEKYPSDNYTLQVSSAGAERELKLPEDLQRFSHLPLRLHFNSNGIMKNEIVKVVQNMGEMIEVEVHSKRKPKEKKSTKYLLRLTDITKGNLYLDI